MPSKRDIKNAIPRHCFNRSALHGFVWIAIDTLQAAVCVWFAYTFLKPAFPSSWFSLEALTFVLGWNFYAFWMGTVLTGHWVIAHECGHMAFSPNQHLNDFVGYILHQALLVPYFAWQFTHAKHHKRTNHLVDGESHVPTTAVENGVGPNGEKLSAYAKLHEWMDDGVFAGFQVRKNSNSFISFHIISFHCICFSFFLSWFVCLRCRFFLSYAEPQVYLDDTN